MNNVKADFTYEVRDEVLCIKDLNLGKMSVTNDIENVVEWIRKLKGWSREKMLATRIVYKDSQGMYDGAQYYGVYVAFIPLRKESLEEAVKEIKEVPWAGR